MALHEVLASRRDTIMHRWKEQVRGTLAPESMPQVELANHLPQFLEEISVALREDANLPTSGDSPERSTTAAGHGEQRLRLGFSLDAVVREYGALRNAVVFVAQEAGDAPGARELQVLFDCLITGVAQAVTEYALQRDTELLRQSNEHFAFIAHELRDPMSSATMAFVQLQQRGNLPPEDRAVRALERGLKRTGELIDQTLQHARVASGIELRRQSTTLRALFDDVEMGAISEAQSKDVTVELVLASDEPVRLDVRLVRSALGNLLRNGVKYSCAGGAVTLRGRVEDGRAKIEVEDSCGGLAPGLAEQAFAPFVRMDEKQTGFGLGLAIAKQAVDAHGGSIRVQNVPGKGCIFVLELPIAEPE